MNYLTYPFHQPKGAVLHDDHKQLDARLEKLAPELESSNCGSFVLDDDASGHSARRSISTLSSLSSIQLREQHNAAFAKLRTATAPPTASEVPDDWRLHKPPSLVNGDWRSFGPTEAVLTVIEQGQRPEKHHVRMDSSERKQSSLWKGTIWLTQTHLLFVLDNDAVPEKAEHESHTENWVHSLRRILSHGHKDIVQEQKIETPPVTGYLNGRPITAFEIPLKSLKKASLKKAAKHAAKRDSAASSSQGALSPVQSRTISPTLSRVQSRNPRSSSRTRQGKSPGGARTPPATEKQAEQAIDFGQLISRKDDPTIVRLYSEDAQRSVKVDIKFLSSLYEEEAKDLTMRLKNHLKHR